MTQANNDDTPMAAICWRILSALREISDKAPHNPWVDELKFIDAAETKWPDRLPDKIELAIHELTESGLLVQQNDRRTGRSIIGLADLVEIHERMGETALIWLSELAKPANLTAVWRPREAWSLIDQHGKLVISGTFSELSNFLTGPTRKMPATANQPPIS